ncbi:hypothetical protein AKJ16_DCAP17108 [Drosera capensis]
MLYRCKGRAINLSYIFTLHGLPLDRAVDLQRHIAEIVSKGCSLFLKCSATSNADDSGPAAFHHWMEKLPCIWSGVDWKCGTIRLGSWISVGACITAVTVQINIAAYLNL